MIVITRIVFRLWWSVVRWDALWAEGSNESVPSGCALNAVLHDPAAACSVYRGEKVGCSHGDLVRVQVRCSTGHFLSILRNAGGLFYQNSAQLIVYWEWRGKTGGRTKPYRTFTRSHKKDYVDLGASWQRCDSLLSERSRTFSVFAALATSSLTLVIIY